MAGYTSERYERRDGIEGLDGLLEFLVAVEVGRQLLLLHRIIDVTDKQFLFGSRQFEGPIYCQHIGLPGIVIIVETHPHYCPFL